MSEPFSARLSAKQIQKGLDELGMPWHNRPVKKGGWTKVSGDEIVNNLAKIHNLNPNDAEGWLKITKLNFGFYWDCELNIHTGQWASFQIRYGLYQNNMYSKGIRNHYPSQDLSIDPETDKKWKGDFVQLVTWWRADAGFIADDGSLNWEEYNRKSIQWIRKVLGINGPDPDKFKGKQRAHKHLAKNSGNKFVQLPVDVLRSSISSNAKIVWSEIYDRCGGGKDASWWSQNKIAENISVNKRTVIRAVKELEDAGFLVVKRRKGSKSVYYPTIPTSD